jgi:hypothetical protein
VRNRVGLGVGNDADFEVGVRVLGLVGFTEKEGLPLDVGDGLFRFEGFPTTVGFKVESFIGLFVELNVARIKIVLLDHGSIISFDKPCKPVKY